MAFFELIAITLCVLKLLIGALASWFVVIYLLTTDYRWVALTYLGFFVLGKCIHQLPSAPSIIIPSP